VRLLLLSATLLMSGTAFASDSGGDEHKRFVVIDAPNATYGCEWLGALFEFDQAFRTGDQQVIAEMVDEGICVPIWNGSTGVVLDNARPHEIEVVVETFERLPSWPPRRLWVLQRHAAMIH